MKISELRSGADKYETVDDIVSRVTKAALAAYPGRDALTAVCLMASNKQHHTSERNAALSCIGKQALIIAILSEDILSKIGGA